MKGDRFALRIVAPTASLALVWVGAGCGANVHGSGFATGVVVAPHQGEVALSGLAAPVGARELGVVDVTGQTTIDRLAPEFSQQVARLGGNFGTVEQVMTHFETTTYFLKQTSSCGSAIDPQICQTARPVSHEVAITEMVGHAYLVEGSR